MIAKHQLEDSPESDISLHSDSENDNIENNEVKAQMSRYKSKSKNRISNSEKENDFDNLMEIPDNGILQISSRIQKVH